jgi:hypothetical protein
MVVAVQEFDTVDVLRLEVETDPTGLVNLVQNPSGELGGWGWITTISGSKIDGGTALTYTGVAGASWFTTEEMPVAAGQYAAARWNATGGTAGYYFRARFEWINSAGAVISSSTQTGYLARNSGVGNLAAQLAPAGTVWARLRFDVYSTNTGTNPGGAHTFTFKEVTVGKAAASATLGAQRANLVPNPSFETDTAGWFAGGDSTIARSTAQAYVGAASLRYTHGSTAGGSFWTLEGRRGIPVTGGASYAISTRSKAATTARTWKFYPQWYDASGNNIGSGSPISLTNTTGGWTAGTGAVTAPASAVTLALDAEVTAVAGEQHYFDAFLVEQAATAGTYFDSATPDAGGWDYGGTTRPPTVLPTRTNLIKNPVPTSMSYYAGEIGSAISFNSSGNYVRAESAGIGNDTFVNPADGASGVSGDAGAMRLGMQAGKTYTVSAEVGPRVDYGTPALANRARRIVVFYRVGGGAYVETPSPLVGVGERTSVTFTLPSGTTEAFIRLYNGYGSQNVGGLPGASSYQDWRKVILEERTSEIATYFDGGTADSTSDFTAYDRGWTGTPNASTSTEAATVTLPYSTALNSALGYLDPVQYLNVIGESHELRIVRQELQVGTLDAVIISRTLDPADSTLIRPGRRARLRALVGGVWEELITGKLLKADVEYELKDPKIPDEKRATISVNLVDAGQPLSQAKRPQGVATIAELPLVLEGAGVPWNVNGSGNQVATATPTTFNDNASALTQLALTRDTRAGYAWVSRRGVVNAWDPGSLPSPAPVVLDETAYSDLKVTFATDDCINAVSFTVQSLGVDGTTTETTYGPYEDATSIETYGRLLKEFTVTGLSKVQVDALAAAILAANKTPVRRVQSVTLPLTKLARVNAHALRDLYDLVQVNNTEVALSANLRVTGVEHVVSTRSWMLTLTFAANGGVASPIFQPPVQSDASPDVGIIELFAGPVSKIPSTKLLCDGSSKAVASYPYLFAVIGYTYGGSGANFNVPNLVDRFPIGAGTKALGTTGGGPTKTLTVANLPGGHPTGYTGSSLMGSGPTPAFGVTATGGTSTPFDVMNPWIALTPVIRAV